MSEWKNFELKDLTIKIGSGATPRGGKEAYKSEGISLIRSQNVLDFSVSLEGLVFIDEEQAYALRNVIIEKDDILINITGDSVARVAKIPPEVIPARVNQHVAILRPNKKKLDSDYLLYYLLNPSFKRHLFRIASDGATRNALTKSDLEELVIRAPEDISDQKEIAKLLSGYDKKITLLRQQNQTLEGLAQTLFKRWFVEFEFPDENGRPYKSSGGKMVESELGEIPEGWRVGNLGEFSSLKSGYAFKSNDFVENNSVKAIKIKDLKGNGVVDISNASSIDSQVTNIDRVKYFKLKEGDIVLAMSGNTTGKIGIIPSHKNGLYLNQRVGKFFLKDVTFRSFVYNFLMSGNYEERILSMGYGSAQPNINPKQIEEIETLIPNERVLADFTKISDPIYIKTLVNSDEIQTLTQLRDTLLPKLMSGEVRVNV